MYESIIVPRKVTTDIFNHYDLIDKIQTLGDNLKESRDLIASFKECINNSYIEGCSIPTLFRVNTLFIDKLLIFYFKKLGLDKFPYLSLIAVGGYGRAEIFPCSDIDILILSTIHPIPDECRDLVEKYISTLWDLKLDIGSSVRSIEDTLNESKNDLTIETNLLETRLITGKESNYQVLLKCLDDDPNWDAKRFLNEKIQELVTRYHSFKDTVYSLEPDVKNTPGGIRDIHVMQWIANFHFSAKTLEDMHLQGMLQQSEYDELVECRNFLYEVRFALHVILKKPDNRLTLDNQVNVAKLLNYEGNSNSSVENLMREFYRTVRRVKELCSMTLQLETIRLTGHLGNDTAQFLNTNFVKRGTLIDILDHDLFINNKNMMLEIFYEAANDKDILGLHVNCLRLLREARRSLKNYLVEDSICRSTFKKILSNPKITTQALMMMHEHRILSAYMQQWANIEGLTQFDMFHSYSVDEHIIRVIKNISELKESQDPKFALYKVVYSQISDPIILTAAAFLHDIAKGKGGHHAQEGAKDATYFCQLHGYTQHQSRLVHFLVLNHLVMSNTAQRRDITDPEVITQFAKLIEDEEHLNLLYCLTIADIAATNEQEWSNWKDSIFKQLYFSTRQALRQGLASPQDVAAHARENQTIALSYLNDFSRETILTFFSAFNQNYFIHYNAKEIAWHTRNILNYAKTDHEKPLILFSQLDNDSTKLLIYVDSKNFSFVNIVYSMALKRLNVQSARIIPNKYKNTLCTIIFQTHNGTQIENDRLKALRKSIIDNFNSKISLEALPKSKINSLFKIKTSITYLPIIGANHTNLEISTLDTPGLLAKIGYALGKCDCKILTARITTTGERADDFFSIVNKDNEVLSDQQKEELEHELLAVLDNANK